jgi:uncharacterized protein (DUF2236 family)
MLWVHATLVEASLSAYQRFQQQLTPDEQENYYQDMAVMARLFGVPRAIIPSQLSDFGSYFDAQIAGDTITVTDTAQQIAAVILRGPLPAPVRLITPAHRLATAALLPPRLRQEYRLHWTPLHTLALEPAARALKLTAMPLMLAAARLRPALTPTAG